MNAATRNPDQLPICNDELEVLTELVSLQDRSIIELGCGSARLARDLLDHYPECRVTALEVEAVQHIATRSMEQCHAHPKLQEASEAQPPRFDLLLC